jgi:hypothetical protein
MHLRALRRSFGGRRLLAFAGLVAVFGVWFVPMASAHNALVTASLACNGSAKFTATAWAGPSAASRTNTDVRVFDSTDNGSTWTQVGTGQFNQANGFTFSGTFSVGSAKTIRVRVQEFANWGDGVKPVGPDYANASGPSNCTTTTTPTTTTTHTTTTPTTTTTHTTTTPTTTTTPPATTTTPPTTTTTPPTTTTTTTPPTTTTASPPPVTTRTTTTTPAGGSAPFLPPAQVAAAKRAAGVLAATRRKAAAAKLKKVTAHAKPASAVAGSAHFTG